MYESSIEAEVMTNKFKPLFLILLFAIAAILAARFIGAHDIAIFDPKGAVASQESALIKTAVLLMLVVALPALVLLYGFAWKYREGHGADYDPEARGSWGGLYLWAIPAVIIFILAFLTWNKTHALDPYKPLASDVKPLTIQAVALDWKWLFIYPEQRLATLNFLEFPERTPLNFELTADGPMNSFWIPQLGGQIYAMSGMKTQVHLVADAPGEFAGKAAEINGRGFAGMNFTAKSVSAADFDAWVASVRQSSATLTMDEYEKLAAPSENEPVAVYASTENDLFNKIIMKFMPPSPGDAMQTGNPMMQ